MEEGLVVGAAIATTTTATATITGQEHLVVEKSLMQDETHPNSTTTDDDPVSKSTNWIEPTTITLPTTTNAGVPPCDDDVGINLTNGKKVELMTVITKEGLVIEQEVIRDEVETQPKGETGSVVRSTDEMKETGKDIVDTRISSSDEVNQDTTEDNKDQLTPHEELVTEEDLGREEMEMQKEELSKTVNKPVSQTNRVEDLVAKVIDTVTLLSDGVNHDTADNTKENVVERHQTSPPPIHRTRLIKDNLDVESFAEENCKFKLSAVTATGEQIVSEKYYDREGVETQKKEISEMENNPVLKDTDRTEETVAEVIDNSGISSSDEIDHDTADDNKDELNPGEELIAENVLDQEEVDTRKKELSEMEDNNLVLKSTDRTEDIIVKTIDNGILSSDEVDHDTADDNKDELNPSEELVVENVLGQDEVDTQKEKLSEMDDKLVSKCIDRTEDTVVKTIDSGISSNDEDDYISTDDNKDELNSGEELIVENVLGQDEVDAQKEELSEMNDKLVSKCTDRTEDTVVKTIDTGISSSDEIDHDTADDNKDELNPSEELVVENVLDQDKVNAQKEVTDDKLVSKCIDRTEDTVVKTIDTGISSSDEVDHDTADDDKDELNPSEELVAENVLGQDEVDTQKEKLSEMDDKLVSKCIDRIEDTVVKTIDSGISSNDEDDYNATDDNKDELNSREDFIVENVLGQDEVDEQKEELSEMNDKLVSKCTDRTEDTVVKTIDTGISSNDEDDYNATDDNKDKLNPSEEFIVENVLGQDEVNTQKKELSKTEDKLVPKCTDRTEEIIIKTIDTGISSNDEDDYNATDDNQKSSQEDQNSPSIHTGMLEVTSGHCNRKDVAALRETIKSNAETISLLTNMAALKKTIKSHAETITLLTKKLSTQENESRAALQEQKDACKSVQQELNANVKYLNGVKERLQSKEDNMIEFKNTLQEKDIVICAIKKELQGKENTLIEIQKTSEEKDKVLDSLQKDLQTKDDDIIELRKREQDIQAALCEMGGELQAKQSALIDIETSSKEKDAVIICLKSRLKSEEDTMLENKNEEKNNNTAFDIKETLQSEQRLSMDLNKQVNEEDKVTCGMYDISQTKSSIQMDLNEHHPNQIDGSNNLMYEETQTKDVNQNMPDKLTSEALLEETESSTELKVSVSSPITDVIDVEVVQEITKSNDNNITLKEIQASQRKEVCELTLEDHINNEVCHSDTEEDESIKNSTQHSSEVSYPSTTNLSRKQLEPCSDDVKDELTDLDCVMPDLDNSSPSERIETEDGNITNEGTESVCVTESSNNTVLTDQSTSKIHKNHSVDIKMPVGTTRASVAMAAVQAMKRVDNMDYVMDYRGLDIHKAPNSNITRSPSAKNLQGTQPSQSSTSPQLLDFQRKANFFNKKKLGESYSTEVIRLRKENAEYAERVALLEEQLSSRESEFKISGNSLHSVISKCRNGTILDSIKASSPTQHGEDLSNDDIQSTNDSDNKITPPQSESTSLLDNETKNHLEIQKEKSTSQSSASSQCQGKAVKDQTEVSHTIDQVDNSSCENAHCINDPDDTSVLLQCKKKSSVDIENKSEPSNETRDLQEENTALLKKIRSLEKEVNNVSALLAETIRAVKGNEREVESIKLEGDEKSEGRGRFGRFMTRKQVNTQNLVDHSNTNIEHLLRVCKVHQFTVLKQRDQIREMEKNLKDSDDDLRKMTLEAKLNSEKIDALEIQFVQINKTQENKDIQPSLSIDSLNDRRSSIIKIDAAYVSTLESNLSKSSTNIKELRNQLKEKQAQHDALKEKVEVTGSLYDKVAAISIKLKARDLTISALEKSYNLQQTSQLDSKEGTTLNCQAQMVPPVINKQHPIDEEKQVILSIRKVSLLQEIFDASSRRLSNILHRVEDAKNTEINMPFVFSLCDKFAIMQDNIKISLHLLEIKLSNELESIRLGNVSGVEEDNGTVQLRFDRTMESLREVEKKNRDVLKELRRDIDHQEIKISAKDSVIEGLVSSENNCNHKIESLQSQLKVLTSLSDYSSVNAGVMSRFKEFSRIENELHEKEQIIDRLNNVIKEYRDLENLS